MANFVQELTCQPYLISWTPAYLVATELYLKKQNRKNCFPTVAEKNTLASVQKNIRKL